MTQRMLHGPGSAVLFWSQASVLLFLLEMDSVLTAVKSSSSLYLLAFHRLESVPTRM